MTRALSLLAVSAALLALSPGEQLRFAPKEGLSLRTSFEREGRLELTSLEMTVDGASHGDIQPPELSIELHAEHSFLDRYAAVEDGRPTRLVRTYEQLSDARVQAVDGEETTLELESELEGRTVVFTWDADEEAYAAAFEDDEGGAELLEGLEARLDLARFLPGREVAEGDSWDVPVEAFRGILRPGGDLHLEADGDAQGGSSAELGDDLDGTIRATLSGTREEDGAQVAVIALEVELSSSEEGPLESGAGERTEVNEFELSGELLWDHAEGRLHALELTGRVSVHADERREVEMGDQTFEVRQSTELSGEVTYHLRVEAQ